MDASHHNLTTDKAFEPFEASFFDELSELQNSDRALLGSLVDEGAPSG